MVTPKTVVICLVEAVIIGSIFSMLTLAGLFENVPSLVVAILLGGNCWARVWHYYKAQK